MITDRSEAFKHNACKKLAQLSKVVFQMSKARIERNEEIDKIIIKNESMIGQIVKQHQKSIEEIAKNLVAFRKSCIDQECQDYALQYKVIKSQLTDLCKEKLTILQNIAKEGEMILSNVYSIQKSSIDESNNNIEYANQIQNKITNHLKKSKISFNKKVEIAIQPILENISNLQKDNEEKMKQILSQHAQNIRQNRTEIYKILHDEILHRKDDFRNKYSQLQSLQEDVNSLRSEYENIRKDQDNFYTNFKNKRDLIFSYTNNNYIEIKNAINNLISKEKNSESERRFQIQELNKVKQTLYNSHQNELNNLISQIQYQKHQIHQLETSKTAEFEKQKSAFEKLTNSLKKDFENNIKNRNGNFSEFEISSSQLLKDLKQIKGHLTSIADESKAKTTNKKDAFHFQIGKEIQSITIAFEKQLNNFKEAAKNRTTILSNSLRNQNNFNLELQKQIRNEIQKLLNDLKNLQTQIENETNEKRKKDESDKAEYQKANQAREQNRKREIEMAMNRKKNEKEKQLSSFQEKWKNEVNEKKQKLENENKIKLEEFSKQSENFMDLTKEENEQQSKLLKMKGKLNFATEQFEHSKKYCEQRLSALQNEIQNAEKQIRQIQRKIKTETQAINEEFEMKIQVEQVKLNNAIENISKLYEKDENMRGVEIIEAIRKLRDIKNRSIDLQAKKKHEIEERQKEFQKKKVEIENEIENLKDKKQKKELNEKLKSLVDKSNSELKAIEEESNSKLSDLTVEISKIKEEQSKKFGEIKIQIEKENNEFQAKAGEIKSKEAAIIKNADEQILNCQNEYEIKKKTLIEKHQDQISKLKNRIESAKKVQLEAIESTTKEYNTAIKDEDDLISRKCNDDHESLKKLSQTFIQKNSELAQTTKDLLVKVSHLHINQIIAPIRKVEEAKLNSMKEELNSKDSELQNLFEKSFKMLETLRSNEQTNNQQQPMQFKVGSNNSKRSTRKSKNEFPKMIDTPKKLLPSIMTPQLV